MECDKKLICFNYPIKCDVCHMQSDIVNHNPYFQDKDLVEVVRCKDCKYRKTEDCAMYYECNCGAQYTWESDNDYCSWAEREEDEE